MQLSSGLHGIRLFDCLWFLPVRIFYSSYFSIKIIKLNLNSKRESPCSKGTCTSIPGVGFVCACQPGYSGRFCNVQIDFCSSNPCLNNGVCIIGTNNYSCSCNLQYTGKNCEILINYCNSNPCLNGATCSIATNFAGYTCSCPSQYTGSTYFSEKLFFI